MEEFFTKMSEAYAQQHFPDGSVIDSARKTTRTRSVAGIFFFVLFLAGSLWGFGWSFIKTYQDVTQGQEDSLTVGLVICGFFGLIALGCFFVLRLMIKAGWQSRDSYFAETAKHCKLPVSEIEAFDSQALASDCYILKLTAGIDRMLSNATNKDGLLTRDYIYLADTAQTVMRVDSLKACCFTEYTYYVSAGNKTKKIRNLAICLIASNGLSILSDTTEKAGRALIDILKERNSAIDTNDGMIVPEGKEFDAYKKKVLENS